MKQQYLALDIGNVLCDIDFSPLFDVLSTSLNKSENDVMYFLNRTQKLHDLGLTGLSDELHDHFHIKDEELINKILTSWNKCVTPNKAAISGITALSSEFNLKIALLSNIGIDHSYHVKKLFKQYPVLDNSMHFFSCEVGARKPTPIFYKTFLDLNPEFKNCIYIDDLQENLDSATKFGMKSIKFDLSDKKTKIKRFFIDIATMLDKEV